MLQLANGLRRLLEWHNDDDNDNNATDLTANKMIDGQFPVQHWSCSGCICCCASSEQKKIWQVLMKCASDIDCCMRTRTLQLLIYWYLLTKTFARCQLISSEQQFTDVQRKREKWSEREHFHINSQNSAVLLCWMLLLWLPMKFLHILATIVIHTYCHRQAAGRYTCLTTFLLLRIACLLCTHSVK